MPGKTWGKLYAIRQKNILNNLERQVVELFKNNSENSTRQKLSDKISITSALKNDTTVKDEATVLGRVFKYFDSDKSIVHNYHYLYGLLFRDKKALYKSILEIGIYKGASLKSWKEYFKDAYIYGIDIDPNTLFTEDKIDTMVGDQNNTQSLIDVGKCINGGFDVVIDDGWHQPEASVNTMMAFIPLLKDGGVYILEDINHKLYASFYTKLAEIINANNGYYAEYIDLDNCTPPIDSKEDSSVLVIKKHPLN